VQFVTEKDMYRPLKSETKSLFPIRNPNTGRKAKAPNASGVNPERTLEEQRRARK